MSRDLPGGAPPEPIAYFQGKYLREGDCRLSVRDRGFLHGDGAFETLRVYRGFPFALERHLERLATTLRFLGIEAPTAFGPWREIAEGLAQVNGLGGEDAVLRITISRGAGDPPVPTVLATVAPLPERARRAAEAGLRAATLATPRAPGPLAAHKTANYLECALGTREAAARGAEEGLFTDAAGNYLEGCTTNLFAVAEGALWTAEAGVLPGVARAIALEAAAEAGMTVRPGAIPGAVLREAEELFLTNSVIEVAGVVELDGRALAGGDIGSVTRRIAAAYRARVEAEREASFPRA